MLMINLNKFLLGGLMIGCIGSSVFADDFTLTGEVPQIGSLTFTGTVTTLPGNLAAGDHALATMKIDNNDPEGFRISVSSEKASKLVRYNGTTFYPDNVQGNFVGYTMTFTPVVGGTLGVTQATNFANPITLTALAVGYDFSTNRTAATVDYKYAIKLTVADPTHLLNSAQSTDVYRDKITISMANL